MQKNTLKTLRLHHLALAALAAVALGTTWADARFGQPDTDFQGRVNVTTQLVLPGSQVTLEGSNFKPGQNVQFIYEGEAISGAPVTADAEGKFKAETTIPKTATPGRHSVVVSATEPSAALIQTLKISPDLAISGADKFNVTAAKTVPGVYQSAYSTKNNALYIAAAIGRPPVKESEIAKLDATTLELKQKISPAEAPSRTNPNGEVQEGGLFAVYGIGVDDVNGNVWVSNTRQNTVAVYRQSDLGLLKQFEPGTIGHPRDVVIDEKNGKVFVNAARGAQVAVFDAKTLDLAKKLELKSPAPQGGPGAGGPARGGPAGPAAFSTMAMSLDKASGKLFVVGAGGEVAVIDTATNAVEKTYAVKGVNGAIAIAYDGASNRIFVGAQGSDNVVAANADNGEVINNVLVGAGTLAVVFDPVKKLVYAGNRGANTITVLDTDGKIVANLEGGPTPNHLLVAPGGVVYALNKGPADSAESNTIRRIQPK